MKTNENEVDDIVRAAVMEEFNYLYDLHRVFITGHGVSSTSYAEAYGLEDVAQESVRTAYEAAYKVANETTCKGKNEIADAARAGAVGVIDAARAKNLLFLRDGSRSATVVLAYLIAQGMKYPNNNNEQAT